MKQATIDNARETSRPFSLMRADDPLSTDIVLEDMQALRDIELEWARGLGIDAERLDEIMASTATQYCINTATGIPAGSDAQLDCVVDNDDPGPPVPA